MPTRLTNWIGSVVSALSGATVANDDKFLIVDSSAGVTKSVRADEMDAIPALVAAFQPLDSDLTAIAALTTTAFGRALLELANAAAIRTAAEVPFSPASSSGAASLDFAEDTDNGSNRVRLQGAASTADVTATLQAVTGTVYVSNGTNTIADAASLITATDNDAALQEAFSGSFSVNTNGTTGSTETLTLQPAHKMTMDQSCAFTFPTPATNGHSFLLWVLGAFTPTFPGSVDWHGGAAPTYVNDSLYAFCTLDGGTTWIGSLIGSNLG